MSNSALIAALGSVAAAIFFLASAYCSARWDGGMMLRVVGIVGFLLTGVYLFVSLFWGLRATMLESTQLKLKDIQEK